MTVVVAVVLAGLFSALKDVHDANEAIYNKRQILGSVKADLGIKDVKTLSDAQVAEYFNKATQLVVNYKGAPVKTDVKAEEVKMEKEEKKPLEERQFPVFIMPTDNGQRYILTVRGNGLWDKIWGWVALEEDLQTVAGAAFGHKGETPGLGAEIKDNESFPAQFAGKKIYKNGEFVAIEVKKGGAVDKTYQVDGISGATITCDGVTDMMLEGIGFYLPYLATVSK